MKMQAHTNAKKNVFTAEMNMNKLSMCGAIVDACSPMIQSRSQVILR
jgi:hypothetical protein